MEPRLRLRRAGSHTVQSGNTMLADILTVQTMIRLRSNAFIYHSYNVYFIITYFQLFA